MTFDFYPCIVGGFAALAFSITFLLKRIAEALEILASRQETHDDQG